MKDLITTIGSITILMVFVMQFCFNQVTITRFLVGDKILDNYEKQTGVESEPLNWDECKKQLANCFSVEESDIEVKEKYDQMIVKIPIRNVIACGDFLGISKERNQAVYCGVINRYEEPDNDNGDNNSNDNA